MEQIKCKDCERGPNGQYKNCTVGNNIHSIENNRGCYIGEKIGGDGNATKQIQITKN